ncbi:APA family basic amino acid/polyamine antiporter [Actinoplanes octamycinicus]|uniref:APA family basic amino acid/polyamine antiporter n=1 Tax=Actinoplanes octamycinicus TaxID=135948 RepID=A0A7W7H103_9ACTN|nr:amino acid permease [Actinoplanes octamycinicus]MBB4741923.1 APA family basic amino acid/polyamine antiporter [Actinoplanes octamycinicus]GIE60687.1 transporter [Actinoplanes octamycinicus]
MADVREAPSKPEATASLGLPQATALILGSIIGVGIFNLPYSLASIGPISIVAMVLTTLGAVALAMMFAALSRRLPADGGPYAYARAAFGNSTGFVNAWSYWITAWAGNAAIVTGWVFYVEKFLNQDHVAGWSILIALVGLWIPAAINLSGVKNTGAVQLWTSIIKYVPLALMSTVGLLAISSGNFSPWNVSGESDLRAIGSAMAICLFSYLGVEAAAVAAAKVRDPERNIPRATLLGTLGASVVYLLSMVAVFGTVPTTELAKDENKASYSVAADAMVGGGTWAGNLVALAVIVSGIGALNGWIMICAEMPLAAAKDGLFPAAFGRISRRGVPAVSIIASTVLGSVAMAVSFMGTSGATVFNTLVLMTGITAAIPYAFSALAQLKWRLRDRRELHTPRFARDATVAVLALIFSVLFIWCSRNTGADNWYEVWGPFLMAGAAMLIGIPVYLRMRTRMTEPPPVPPYH